MRNRMTLAASSVVVLVVAASSLGVQPGNAQTAKAQAKDKAKADECQSRPGTSTPRGSHWYYRLERPSGRRCWYLGAVNQKRQAATTEQAAPAERAERAAPVARRAASVPPPLPRPNALRADEETEIPTNATATNIADGNAPANAATTNAGPAAAHQFAAGWPAVPNGAPAPNDRDVTTAVAGSTDANAAEVATAEVSPEDTQADLPMVWPVLAANERATAAQASEAAPGLGHLLIFLAATVAFVAIAVRASLQLLSSARGRSRPMAPAARAAAPIIRPRAPGSPAAPEFLVRETNQATTAPAVERLREVAKRWETPARVPRQPRIPAYEVMSEYEEKTPPVRRRAVA
jgi:hypothetical protein